MIRRWLPAPAVSAPRSWPRFPDFVKTGAEGVNCGAVPEAGLGIAVKCDDGATRAAETMMAAVLAALLPMTAAERDLFGERLTRPIAIRAGVKVGEIRSVAGLVEAIRDGCNVG